MVLLTAVVSLSCWALGEEQTKSQAPCSPVQPPKRGLMFPHKEQIMSWLSGEPDTKLQSLRKPNIPILKCFLLKAGSEQITDDRGLVSINPPRFSGPLKQLEQYIVRAKCKAFENWGPSGERGKEPWWKGWSGACRIDIWKFCRTNEHPSSQFYYWPLIFLDSFPIQQPFEKILSATAKCSMFHPIFRISGNSIYKNWIRFNKKHLFLTPWNKSLASSCIFKNKPTKCCKGVPLLPDTEGSELHLQQ